MFVHRKRFCDASPKRLAATRGVILGCAAKHGDLVSRAGIVADHVHLLLGPMPAHSPAEVALRYVNNLTYSWGMKPAFEYGYYVGTCGEYDLGVIPR